MAIDELLEYRDGHLYWKVSRGRVRTGSLAGTEMQTEDGHIYRKVRVNGRQYLAHRLIWELLTGVQLTFDQKIDHINGNTLDNRISNLRVCTNTQNAQNIHARRGMYSQLKGVTFHKRTGKFVAQIRVNGVSRWLGSFLTEEEAARAYAEAANSNFKEFANVDKV